MSVIKIIIFSVVLFIVFTAVLIFAIPSVRQGVLAGKSKEEATGEGVIQEKKMTPDEEEKDRIIKMLKEKEKELAKREETIVVQEKRISSLREEVESLKKTVEVYQDNIEQYVVKIDESKGKNLKKLAEVFSKMAAEDASQIIANLSDTTVVSIFAFMKDRSSARLLGTYSQISEDSSLRAAHLSEMMKQVIIK
ncbi:MAG: hypothetical protein KAI43_03215 [Candidatus Aureabacteria bacterium]|nr:hypothetical protein [Candidatus Auribacterota bacterium]